MEMPFQMIWYMTPPPLRELEIITTAAVIPHHRPYNNTCTLDSEASTVMTARRLADEIIITQSSTVGTLLLLLCEKAINISSVRL